MLYLLIVKLRSLSSVGVLVFAAAVFAWGAATPTPVDFSLRTAEIPVTSWNITRAYPFGQGPDSSGVDASSGLDHDYLKEETAQTEAEIDAGKFAKAALRVIATDSVTHILELTKAFGPCDYAIVYAGAVLKSSKPLDVTLAIGADDAMRVWLNGELLFSDTPDALHGLTKHQRILGAHLKAGDNFLMVKVANQQGDWRLIATVYPFQRGLTLARENAVDPLLENSVVASGKQLLVRRDLLEAGKARVDIVDFEGNTVASKPLDKGRRTALDLSALTPERVYRCRIVSGKTELSSAFLYGDPAATLKALKTRADAPGADGLRINVSANQARLEHLLKPENRLSEYWERKVVSVMDDYFRIVVNLEHSREAFRDAPGPHIRGYRSKVDGQVQHYWIHAPAAQVRSGKPMPLVIAMPFITGTEFPFLQSYFLAAQDETERYMALGDEYGFAVLQPWGRGNYLGGTPLGTEDVMQALEAVRKDYNIDATRIYLLGYCEAGRLGLLLAERFPDRFAAVAVEGPLTYLDPTGTYADMWRRLSAPFAAYRNLVNTPVLIVHDRGDNVPIRLSQQFVADCEEAGGKATLVEDHGGSHGFYQDPMATKRELFHFFVGKQVAKSPPRVAIETGELKYGAAWWLRIGELAQEMKAGHVDAALKPGGRLDVAADKVREFEISGAALPGSPKALTVWVNGKEAYRGPAGKILIFRDGVLSNKRPAAKTVVKSATLEGPLMDAFAGPSLLVVGTAGNEGENRAIRQLADAFRAEWQKAYFVDFPEKTDGEVTDEDLQAFNLILIGDERTNSVVARTKEQLRFSAPEGGLSIGGRSYPAGHVYGYDVVRPSPFNRARYAVAVGMTAWEEGKVWDMHFSRNGVADYRVWNLDAAKAEIEDAGYFDVAWSAAKSLRYDQAAFVAAPGARR